MRISHSRVDCWRQCPLKFKFKYIDEIPEEPDYTATNPLVLGSTLDRAVEFGMEKATEYYWDNYFVASDEGITELMKIEHWLPKIQDIFDGAELQVKIERDGFLGFADAIVGDTLYDLKYSNNAEKYAESDQLHLYASELPEKPKRMAYVCVPKTFIRQKKTEDIIQFRKRVMETLNGMEIKIVWVDYDQSKVDKFWQDAEAMKHDTTFARKENEYCKYCSYKELCNNANSNVKDRSEIEKLLNS